MSDEVSVYECTSADEAADLLARSQGVAWPECTASRSAGAGKSLAGDLAALSHVQAGDSFITADPVSPGSGTSQGSLAERRLRRSG